MITKQIASIFILLYKKFKNLLNNFPALLLYNKIIIFILVGYAEIFTGHFLHCKIYIYKKPINKLNVSTSL